MTCKVRLKAFTDLFFVNTGAKKTINLERTGTAMASILLAIAICSAFFSKDTDRNFFIQSHEIQERKSELSQLNGSQGKGLKLFSYGLTQLTEQKKMEAARKRGEISINYFAPQVIGMNSKSAKSVKMGAKFLGFLLTSIDTRESSMVSVVLPQGGTSDSGFEIPKNTVLIGSFSYRGDGDKVSLSFSRLDTPDGDSLRIAATGLDAADYTAGIRGEVHSDDGLKVASTLGLTMAASMTDVLTQREALGTSMGPAQAKPTMQNALLQGISQSAKDQAGRTSEEINSTKDYVFIPKGKEVIVQLSEDLK